jgi:hypothetical protein
MRLSSYEENGCMCNLHLLIFSQSTTINRLFYCFVWPTTCRSILQSTIGSIRTLRFLDFTFFKVTWQFLIHFWCHWLWEDIFWEHILVRNSKDF